MRKLFATLILLLVAGSASAQFRGEALNTGTCSNDGTCGTLKQDQYIENGIYRLYMQWDGNVVLYENFSTTRKVVWATNTDGKGGTFAVIQQDGNFVIYRPNGTGVAPVWASNTGGKPSAAAWVRLATNGALTVEHGQNPTTVTMIYPGPNTGTVGTCTQPRSYPICFGRGTMAPLQLVATACSETDARKIASQMNASWGPCW